VSPLQPNHKTIVLKIDVDTFRGTREGVLPLVTLFKKYQCQATFLWSLGPDHTGWALRRAFRPGFFKKVQRTSVVSHYGLKTLMYGVLLPAPMIGKSCAALMRMVDAEGFEMGIHCYDHVYWQDNVMNKSKEWTDKQLEKAYKTFYNVFGREPKTHGAAGWQMNAAGFDWLERFEFASDTRGANPFYPRINDKAGACLQMPTTLPTMDELLGVGEINESNIHEELLRLTAEPTEWGHVYTLHAEMEGMKLLPAFEKFIIGLKEQGYTFLSMENYARELKEKRAKQIPIQPVEYREIPGRSGKLAVQGATV
jgi:undecaprenyl phosphate-alpha-L-ara4FN deformylase